MENGIQIFSNPEFGEIRTITINGDPWFVGKDVAEILGYERSSKAIVDRIDEEDRRMIDGKTQSQFGIELGQRGGWVISESGLYSLILSSKLEGAKKFKRWVTSEVLPAIRKTGGYIAGQDEMSPEELMSKALLVAQKTLEEREKRLAALTTQNEIMKPKADYFDDLVDRNMLTNFRETAKEFKVSPKRFVNWLIDNKYIYRDKKNKILPYEDKNEGLFEIKEAKNENSNWSGVQTLITPKGRETFRLLCQKDLQVT